MFDSKRKTEEGRLQLGDIALVVMILIATIANFTDFGLSFNGITKLTAVSALIFVVTTITYNHCFNKGKFEGKLDKTYIDTVAEYRSELDKVFAANLTGRIQEFIEGYIKDELIEYRKSILIKYDIGYEEYAEKYLPMTFRKILRLKMRFGAKVAIIKCNRAKPASISKTDIISFDGEGNKRSKPIGKSGHNLERKDKVMSTVKRAVITIFSGAVGVDLVFNFSLVTAVQWAIRMMPIFIAMITGQPNGFKNITETEVEFKSNQTNMIRLFMEWNSTHPVTVEQCNTSEMEENTTYSMVH